MDDEKKIIARRIALVLKKHLPEVEKVIMLTELEHLMILFRDGRSVALSLGDVERPVEDLYDINDDNVDDLAEEYLDDLK